MPRHIFDEQGHAHFVTFSCFGRRRLLDHDGAKGIVVSTLAHQLSRLESRCFGFVVMPNHVHALLWFSRTGTLSVFMKHWKQRSSFEIKQFLKGGIPEYTGRIDLGDPVWQPRYYDFNVYSEKKLLEKLEYMHCNPVRAELTDAPREWLFSSARFYEMGESVAVPVTPWNELHLLSLRDPDV